MPKNPHADFTPALEGYSGQGKFRFWCQMALPLTYDDSLSYYELLCKVVNYLNHTIEDVANAETNVSRLAEAYTQLQTYVNDYFDNLDVEAELRNVLDAMAEDGTLDDLLDPLVQDHLPAVVDEQIDDVVADQIDDAVAGQIGDVVAEQLPPLVEEGIPGEVSEWLTENVDPVGSAVVVDSSLTISGAAADAKVTGDELTDLKTQLDDVESLVELNAGNKILDTWTPSSYYKLTSSVITVDINDPEESGGWQCMCVACQQGDVFYLTTTGTSTARPYAFLSSANGENNIITKAGSNDTVFENYKLIAPAGSAYAIFNSLVSEKSSVIKGELGKDAGWTFTNVNIPFEIGNISFSTDGPTYKYDRYSRARTPQGYSLYLHDGDVVGLTDYTNARYYIAWWDDSNVFHYSSAESADRKITQNGKYIFLLRNATEVSLFDDLSSLTNLFFAKIKTDANQLYSESCGYGERYVQKDASGLNYHLFNHASPKFAMHRGCSTLAPENTAPAFNLAGENGAWGIETDVFETTDGYFVCHHDSTVDRMTDGTGNITSMSLSQVEALTIDAGANIEEYPNLKIPRLETFLSICRRYGCVGLIEIKTVTNYQNLINIIRKAGMENSVLFLVTTYPLVPIVKYYTKAPVALIGYDTSINADLISTVDTFVNACVDVYASLVIDDTDIIKAHTYNVPFMAWVVDDESRADELFRLGVDVITSNVICNFTN